MEKIGRVNLQLKAVTICSKEEEGYDYKNNYGHGKSANFQPDNISRMNCKKRVVLLNTSSKLGLRKV